MQQNQIEALVKVANAEYPLAPQETNLLKIATVVEKRASMLQSLLAWAQQNPELATTALGTLAGGGLGALFSGRDEEGETHRGRNALLGALLGGGSGALAGYYGKGKIQQYLGDWLNKLRPEKKAPSVLDKADAFVKEHENDPAFNTSPDMVMDEATLRRKADEADRPGGSHMVNVDPALAERIMNRQIAEAKAGLRQEKDMAMDFADKVNKFTGGAPDNSPKTEYALQHIASRMGVKPNSEQFFRLRNMYYGRLPEDMGGSGVNIFGMTGVPNYKPIITTLGTPGMR